jgi:hypothetical protein
MTRNWRVSGLLDAAVAASLPIIRRHGLAAGLARS